MRSAHYGMSVKDRYADPLLAWPDGAIHEHLKAMAAWCVKHRQTIDVLYSMCCAQAPDASEAAVLPYLLYTSTQPFNFEGRDAHPNLLNSIGRVLQ